MLVADLQNYHQQFRAIELDAQDLLAELGDIQFNWRPGANRWSLRRNVSRLSSGGLR